MKKQKTRKELKDNKDAWVIVAIVLLSLFMLYSILNDNEVNRLKTQLSECQKQVPNILWKHIAVSGEDFKFFIDGERFFDGSNKTISFWVQTVVDKSYDSRGFARELNPAREYNFLHGNGFCIIKNQVAQK